MAITQTTDLDSAATTAYELRQFFALRSKTLYCTPAIAKVQATNQTHRGSTVKFWFTPDLAAAVTPLTENTDVTPGNTSDTSVDVTITEYGAATAYTVKMKGTNMLDYDPTVAELNARQSADSFEALARTAALAGTNVLYAGTGNAATADVAAGDNITSHLFRKAVATMSAASVEPIANGLYAAFIHPFQSLDLREETGDAAWVTARNYQDLTKIETGEIGTHGGAVFYESPRIHSATDGTASARVYRAHVVGAEAMAMAYSKNVSGPMPETRVSPVIDNLSRFRGIGWYWLGGFKVFRQEALTRIESTVST